MLEYFKREEAPLTVSINLSSDIIESTFGIYKSKKSPNKLYGVTSFVRAPAQELGYRTNQDAQKSELKLAQRTGHPI